MIPSLESLFKLIILFVKTNKKYILIILILLANLSVFFLDKGIFREIDVTRGIQGNADLAGKFWGNQFFSIKPDKVKGNEIDSATAYAPSFLTLKVGSTGLKGLSFKYGISDNAIGRGDGVVFKIEALTNTDNEPRVIFEDIILPASNKEENKLYSDKIKLDDYKNSNLKLFFVTEDNGNNAFDQAFWADVKATYQVPIYFYYFVLVSFILLFVVCRPLYFIEFFRKNKIEYLIPFLLFFAFLYLYFLTQGTYHFHEYRQGTYYNWLAQQFYFDRLGEPVVRVEGENDMSYFEGRKFLYFGPLPAVLHLIYLKIFKSIIFGSLLTYIFSITNLLLFWLNLLKIKRRYFPEYSIWSASLMFATYAAGPLLFCVSRSFIYEEAIIVGSAFLLGGIYFYLSGLFRENGRNLLFFVGNIMVALAFLSRSDLILYSIIPILFLFLTLKKKSIKDLFKLFAKATIVYLPILAAISLFLTYNYLRFHDPIETGVSYISSGSQEGKNRILNKQLNSKYYIPYNLYNYFLAVPDYNEKKYKDITVGLFPKLEDSHYVYSIFLSFPLSSFIFYYFYLLFRKKEKLNKELKIILLIISFPTIIVLGALLTFTGATRRYLLDFFPPMLIISYVGLELFMINVMRQKRITIYLLLLIALLFSFVLNYMTTCNFAFKGNMEKCMNIYNKEYILLN